MSEMQTPSPMPTAVMSTNRLEAFSDGVFAIVITLLVLDLRLDSASAGQPMFQRLWAVWPRIISYLITFIYVGIFWVGHHGLFHLIKRIDKTLMWLNLMFLMCISFLPFPASIMGLNPLNPTAIRFYTGTLLCGSLTISLIWTYASWNHRLTHRDLAEEANRILWQRIYMAPCINGFAFLCSFWEPRLSLVVMPLVPLLYIPPNRFDPRHIKS
jgi:uncharacterized membrane protein